MLLDMDILDCQTRSIYNGIVFSGEKLSMNCLLTPYHSLIKSHILLKYMQKLLIISI